MNAPQIIVLVLNFIVICLHCYMHGKMIPTQRHQGFQRVIGIMIYLGLLYWGGFWNEK